MKYYQLVYPESRSISEDNVRRMYEDLVVSGELRPGLTDIYQMINALEITGRFAFGRNENYR